MDFSFTEEQETVGKVARQLFEHRATPEHLTALEAGGGVRFDPALWSELAASDLLGIALPESVGGSGGGHWSWRYCSPRSGGAWRRSPCTRHCCSARIPLLDTVIRHYKTVICRAWWTAVRF